MDQYYQGSLTAYSDRRRNYEILLDYDVNCSSEDRLGRSLEGQVLRDVFKQVSSSVVIVRSIQTDVIATPQSQLGISSVRVGSAYYNRRGRHNRSTFGSDSRKLLLSYLAVKSSRQGSSHLSPQAMWLS